MLADFPKKRTGKTGFPLPRGRSSCRLRSRRRPPLWILFFPPVLVPFSAPSPSSSTGLLRMCRLLFSSYCRCRVPDIWVRELFRVGCSLVGTPGERLRRPGATIRNRGDRRTVTNA
ncbi:hypothetical protein NDU88_004431 [Pleurodeles waltl]|uniref:Uncharacterized protein n=1 Tax=Pleurodeles waltl TaxID=8319 RepID=A0AAV7TRW8_PLEWA|nr:hypothetical protein NDU88_004431 [Pleurodeles waltl]